jgi:hypothetical protein
MVIGLSMPVAVDLLKVAEGPQKGTRRRYTRLLSDGLSP